MEKKKAIEYIVKKLLSGERNLKKLKNEASKKFHLEGVVRNADILSRIPRNKRTKELILMLKKKPVRTLSGVSPVAVMIKPEGSCPWKCVYCPFTGKAAKSYSGYEPAAMRARDNKFDPLKQTKTRLKQFKETGHSTDKCEVIVMGGTFLRMPEKYKRYFIKGVYDGLNGKKSKSIPDAKEINEKSKHRMVGLTIETRPDVCGEKEIDEMLDYGATRVELGVQNPDDRIYKIINRGHKVKDVIKATRLLKDSGFKVLYHLMPGLPGSDKKKDISAIKKIFSNPDFRPDMLKIYPTLVMEGTEAYEMMKKGKYKPYTTEEAVDIISEFYTYVPEYVRVMRVQRDIPANLIFNGVKKSNLRELVERKIREKGIEIKEIRSREVGLKKPGKLSLKRIDYKASKGKEIFLSFEDNGLIAGFLRLRIPYKSHRKEIGNDSAIVRELHVYGEETPLRKKGKIQHSGIGSKLLEKAEEIAKSFNKKKMVIISGVGVREYYYKRGYSLDGPYVLKTL